MVDFVHRLVGGLRPLVWCPSEVVVLSTSMNQFIHRITPSFGFFRQEGAMDDDSIASDRVGIVGLGRLGLCQALTLERAGYDVLGCDVFPAYVDSINNKTLQSDEPGVVSLLRASTKLRATLSLEAVVDHSDLVMVVVATPTGIGEHAYDCGTLSRVLEDISKLGRRDKHVVICCTVLPGYIAQVASSLLEGCAGCTISYNPEFIAQVRVWVGV